MTRITRRPPPPKTQPRRNPCERVALAICARVYGGSCTCAEQGSAHVCSTMRFAAAAAAREIRGLPADALAGEPESAAEEAARAHAAKRAEEKP